MDRTKTSARQRARAAFRCVGTAAAALLLIAAVAGCGSTPPTPLTVVGTKPLAVADTNNSRVLIFQPSFNNGMSASFVLGQASLTTSAPPAAPPSASALNLPQGVAYDATGNLWVADTTNNRVLDFPKPFSNGESATIVEGQAGFTTSAAGGGASNLNGPAALVFDGAGNLWVADTLNNRVLMYPAASITASGAAATVILGTGLGPSASGMNHPHGLAFDHSGNLLVSDLNNNRIMEFMPPFTSGMSATAFIGQPNFTSGGAATSQTGLDGPQGLAIDNGGNLWAADNLNNRALQFPSPFSTNEMASLVLGQPNFNSALPGTDQKTAKAPAATAVDPGGIIYVSDHNNNRVLLFFPPIVIGGFADVVIGQTSFFTNTGGSGATGLSGPSGLAVSP